MTAASMPRSASGPHWFDAWTRDLARDVTAEDLQRLFTHDTRDAYRFFSRGLDEDRLARDAVVEARSSLRVRQVFVAFTLKLSPARRALYLVALVVALIGVIKLFRGLVAGRAAVRHAVLQRRGVRAAVGRRHASRCSSASSWSTCWCCSRSPIGCRSRASSRSRARSSSRCCRRAPTRAGDAEICGVTRPANTVGGDFYDVLPLADGRRDRHARRRRRQRQSGGAADGVAARGAAHARRRESSSRARSSRG